MVREVQQTPRARRRQARIDAIVDAALTILEEEGAEALSMQRLAQDLGYAVGAFYRYFPSKDALWAAMQLRALAALGRDIEAAMEAATREPAVRGIRAGGGRALDAVVRAGWAFATLETRRAAHAVLIRASIADPRQLVHAGEAEPVAVALTGLLGRVAERIGAATEAELLRPGDPYLRSVALWAALAGAASLRKLERYAPDALNADALGRELLFTLLAGWGAPRAPLARILDRALSAPPPYLEEARP